MRHDVHVQPVRWPGVVVQNGSRNSEELQEQRHKVVAALDLENLLEEVYEILFRRGQNDDQQYNRSFSLCWAEQDLTLDLVDAVEVFWCSRYDSKSLCI